MKQNAKVQIDYKVRLSPSQKIAIIAAHDAGGKFERLSYENLVTFQSLKLIHQLGISDNERREIAQNWYLTAAGLEYVEKGTVLVTR